MINHWFYDNKNRFIFFYKRYSISQLDILYILCGCSYYYIIVVRQYIAIVIILADQNHVIRLLQCIIRIIIMYPIY